MRMSTSVTLLCLCTLVLHVSWTWGSELRYRNVRKVQPVESTVQRFARAESNVTVMDTHTYYRSFYYPPSDPRTGALWYDLSSMVGTGGVQVDNLTSQLSGLHRYYEVHDLKFKFPFYGHTLDSIAVTTGGFLYTGDLLHDQVAATQYIAPLQADFNPNHTDTGRVLVLNTEERFTVQWDNVHNNDHLDDGAFTFQVSIFPSGVIHFVYKEVPLLLDEIDNEGHPVEVGVSDAFYFFERVNQGIAVTIYIYDRVSLGSNKNLSNSAYILSPLLNCVSATSCDQCANITIVSEFDCGWCDNLKICSDGIDRHRQRWVNAGCHQEQGTMCKPPTTTPTTTSTAPTTSTSPTTGTSPNTNTLQSHPSSSSSSLSTSARAGIGATVIVVVLLVALVLLGLALFMYAYRRPNSKMGQFLIKHRPGARTLNKNSSASYDVSTEKAALEEDLQ